MVYLPDVMPASFQATYTPVESAGTDAQIRHLARLMATQMTAAGIGPGTLEINGKEKQNRKCKCKSLDADQFNGFSFIFVTIYVLAGSN